MMNAGILLLEDGTPCIVYDEALPHPVQSVEFNPRDFQVTLVYEIPVADSAAKPDPFKARQAPTSLLQTSKIAQMMKTPKKEGRKLDYPLDHEFLPVLESRKTVALGVVVNGQVTEIRTVPFAFSSR